MRFKFSGLEYYALEEFIKTYGSVLSPTIAFLLGIVAVLIKYSLDDYVQSRQTKKSFAKAKEMLSRIVLPEYRYSKVGAQNNDVLFDAAAAHNMANLSRMYFSVKATYMYLKSFEDGINKSDDLKTINQYFYLVWRLKSLILELEDIRESGGKINVDTWTWLQIEIPDLLKFLEDSWFELK